MKKIVILASGGTISGSGLTALDFKDYKTGSYTIEDITRSVPQLAELAEITVEQLFNISSCDITSEHWIFIKQRVEHYLIERGYDGAVITHGTNTLEESAYFLNLTLATDKPVVFVGSQRPLDVLGSDAGINLHRAVRVAVDEQSRGKGVLIVLNDEINAAREGTKTNTYRLQTFQSGQMGLLGYVDIDGTVQYYREPVRKHTIHSRFSQVPLQALPEVAIVYSYLGAKGDVIRYLTESKRYQGIVVAGTGAGKVSSDEELALAEASRQGIFVVRSSRVGNGRVTALNQYQGYGFVTADNLLPQKARILLMLALLETNRKDAIQQFFHEY